MALSPFSGFGGPEAQKTILARAVEACRQQFIAVDRKSVV